MIQIRGVPDEVHRKLVEAAEADGKSLTTYLNDELALIASRVDLVWHNHQMILAGQAAIGGKPSHGDALKALHEGRAEREADLMRSTRRRRK